MARVPSHATRVLLWPLAMGFVGAWPSAIAAQETQPAIKPVVDANALAAIGRDYATNVRPLLQKYCFECHAKDTTEAEIDLGAERTVDDARKHLRVWLKVRGMLDTQQMPPKDTPQPTEAERLQMQTWVRRFLAHEAAAHAGDPGPVVLRRLNNAEYAYTVRDLTGVASLDPTQEFPVDGGSGEGFTNTGSGQGMSPALVQKYLDAGKAIASHAVLTPTGIRFSLHQTRSDHTNELMAQIQAFYRQYTEDGGGVSVNLQGIKFDTNQGGRLPLKRYLAATLQERDALRAGTKTIAQVAHERTLSPKYLGLLWQAFNAPPEKSPSPWLAPIRKSWQELANNADPGPLTGQIEATHKVLWKTNSIGHIGREGGAKSWLEPISPFVMQQELRFPLPATKPGEDVVFYLAASDLGDGRDEDVVLWKNPRIEFKATKEAARPPIALRDVRWFVSGYEKFVASHLEKTPTYLHAVQALTAVTENRDERLKDIASEQQLDPQLLARWSRVAGWAIAGPRQITGHFSAKVTKVGGHNALNGWGSSQTPVLLTNRGPDPIPLGTLTVPARGVTLHPSPTQDIYVAWKSPLNGSVRIRGKIADADDKCGNGATWRIEALTAAGTNVLAAGDFENGKTGAFNIEKPLDVKAGDAVFVVIGAKNKEHTCDTTHVDLQIEETAGAKRAWDLSKELVDRVLEGNPLADSLGHAEVWHIGAISGGKEAIDPLPADSVLARWRTAAQDRAAAEMVEALAKEVQQLLTAKDASKFSAADQKLRELLLASDGPLGWTTTGSTAAKREAAADSAYGVDPQWFAAADSNDLRLHAPQVIAVKLPSGMFHGGDFVATVTLHPQQGKRGTVQVTATGTRPADNAVTWSSPVLVGAEQQPGALAAACDQFRELFPPALCYARIVPVDEVVTLTLYHREDGLLRKLMLDDAQARELDRLWDEMLYVAQEPLALTVAFEQLSEFATQDRPDLVTAFEPLRKPILARADSFRERLRSTEPAHVEGVLEFADRAWRRPMTESEKQSLRELYRKLRASEVAHEETVRLLLARVLTSPAFLYKMEQPAAGAKAAAVSNHELATRLSYFLCSTAPDVELRKAAQQEKLRDDEELRRQTQRLIADPRSRRLAVEFACQWLHVRDFDKNNDKNEKLFPEFANLRDDMYEETVRFVDDLFRHNGSILSFLDADHTFLNGELAKLYGIGGVSGAEWRRVEGLRGQGRGGMLGMATILASQSGASRTSPILRGNWVYETILGEKLPRPPATVPQLPDETPARLTERQLIEKHSADELCAKCHRKIDPFGFALEQFDPIGRLRPQRLDVKTTLPGDVEVEGLAGLKHYLLTARRQDFVRQFCRKLLGYALGRETQLSDEPLLEAMRERLERGEYRFHLAVEAIVLSPQFRQIRGQQVVEE